MATEEHLKNATLTPHTGPNPAHFSTEWSTAYSDQLPETGQDHILDFIKLNLRFVPDNDHLEECLSKYTPKNFVPPTSINWLEKKIYENQYYGPLAKYLNDILTRTREAYYTKGNEPVEACALDTVFTENFRWFPFNRHAASQFSSKLKPDLAGAILDDPDHQLPILTTSESKKSSTNIATISWEHAVTFGEVNRLWLNMVVQSASYARQIFAHQPHRTSVRCGLFNQQTKMAAIAEFDRGGGYGTHWVFLLQKDPISLNGHNDTDEIFDVQPNMDEDEYIQLGVSGKKRAAPRPTRAVVSVRPKVPVEAHSQDLRGDTNNDKDNKSPFVQIEYWNHILHRDDDDRAVLSALSELRLKRGLLVRGLASYGQRKEGRVTLFAQGPAKDCKDPNYYFTDAYQGLNKDTKLPIQHAQDETSPMSTKKFTDNLNASESRSTNVKTRLLSPYPRYETTQECLEVGYSLLEAKNGLDLIEGILGALYGYRNLYHLGYLHRDISPGNIIIVDPELRKEENVVDIVPNDGRRVLDNVAPGDEALIPLLCNDNSGPNPKKVSEPTRGMLIDGTRIFIACNLLDNVRAKPSPVYDMESFFWTFLYMALDQNHQNLDSTDKNRLERLVPQNRSYQDDSDVKFRLLSALCNEKSFRETSVLYRYRFLVSMLAGFSLSLVRREFDETFQPYDSLTELGAIEQYITVFEQSLERFRLNGSC
ncbi:hypothetical protein FISHEDRAFT_58501 [Fistulina hepatica ATCC 64428]|uniref:Fungal-type protein kinase domain-containing protein n=1 Tax=Fistulina hepatica ATCC 64428 TaxID=1128425 RepID=A0A0D7AEF7_9AGAR|nr:hypothetical protein FISHEDRAFT_58501 [Fistulina hepatica ATCC 64428]